MKSRLFVLSSILFSFKIILAQAPPITTGLVLRLDAAVATSFHSNGANPSVWDDLSGAGNHVTAILTGNALTGATNPTWTTGTNPYVKFSGSSIMSRKSSILNGTVGSVFIVSSDVDTIADYALFAVGDSGGTNQYTNNEFCIVNGNTCTHSAPSNWVWRSKLCAVPTTVSKSIHTCIWNNGGITNTALDHYINGVMSTNNLKTTGMPSGLSSSNNRSLFIGSRIYNGFWQPLNGRIYEVLVYNRALTATEITSVNNFLKTKYSISYNTCNTSIIVPSGINEHEEIGSNALTINQFGNSNMIQVNYFLPQINCPATIIVTDVMGKLVKNIPIYVDAESGEIKIETAEWENQVYLISLQQNNQIIKTSKFVLMND